MATTHLWLRAESKPFEQRTALTPNGAEALLKAGFRVTIEKSEQNLFSDQSYLELGCELAETGSWQQAPLEAIILGMKELPQASFPLRHRHIYFAHVYKEQKGWQGLLQRFIQGQGCLYDLEYLKDPQGRRIAAFGFWAGFAGAALAVQAWLNQQQGLRPALTDVSAFSHQQHLLDQLSQAITEVGSAPEIMIMGAKGRSGCGAVKLAQSLGLKTIEWDIEETRAGGPFPQILQADILVNCVFVQQDLPPFLTPALLSQPRRLSVITDVSCDPYGSYNPLPIYHSCTTFDQPVLDLSNDAGNLELIAIDHLPSLLPRESSEDYCQQLLPHLLILNDTRSGVWPGAYDVFKHKIAPL